MKKLTDKKIKFVQKIVEGKSHREAYKIAYNTSKMKDETIDKRASELFCEGITKVGELLPSAAVSGSLYSPEKRSINLGICHSTVINAISNSNIISTNLSANRVPKPLLKGTELYLSSIAQREISPKRGIIIFAAYPVKTVSVVSRCGTL